MLSQSEVDTFFTKPSAKYQADRLKSVGIPSKIKNTGGYGSKKWSLTVSSSNLRKARQLLGHYERSEYFRPKDNPKRGTTVPAHVRINPRNGRIQVFVTPKVAEKLRGGKGLRVAGNPKLPELRRDLFKVVKTSPVGYGVKGKDGFMWLSGSGKTQATKLARQMNYEDRYRQQRSETARHL